jgi:hypothetical protein
MATVRAILAIGKPDGGKVLAAGFLVAKIIRELGQRLELKCRIHYGSSLP